MNSVSLNVCRACLWNQNAGIHLFSAVDDEYDLPLSDEFREITSIVIEEDDELPQFICYKCYDQLKIAYKFRKTCRTSEDRLRTIDIKDVLKSIQQLDDAESDHNNRKNEEFESNVKPIMLAEINPDSNEPTSINRLTGDERVHVQRNNGRLRMKIEYESEEKTINPSESREPPPLYKNEDDIETQIKATEILKEPIVYQPQSQQDLFNYDDFDDIDVIEQTETNCIPHGQMNSSVSPIFFENFVKESPVVIDPDESDVGIVDVHTIENGGEKMLIDVNDMIIDERETTSDDELNESYEKKQSVESLEIFYCVRCGTVFITALDLQNHIAKARCGYGNQFVEQHTMAGNNLFECEVCKSTFQTQLQLAQHRAHHLKNATINQPTQKYIELIEDYDDLITNASISPQTENNDLNSDDDENDNIVENGGRKYPCGKCELVSFSVIEYREFHEKKCKGRNSECFLCWFCGLDLKAFGKLYSHIQKSHRKEYKEKPFQCEICYKHFDRRTNLERHLTMKHFRSNTKQPNRWASNQYKCDICDKICFTKSNFETHKSTHEDRKYKCPHCPMRYSREIVLNQHLQLHDDTIPKYNCSTCHLFFLNPDRLVEHNRKVHAINREVFKCEKCARDILLENKEKHMRMHEENSVAAKRLPTPDIIDRFECNYCGRRFKQSSTLHTHLALHTGKMVECTLCNAKFSRQSFLNVHMRTHSGDLPYKCEQCDQKFSQNVALENHIANQHTENLFTCDYCQKSFKDVDNLKLHVKAIHMMDKKRRNHCFKCEISFSTTEEYNHHSQLHTTSNDPKYIKIMSSLLETTVDNSFGLSVSDAVTDVMATSIDSFTDDGMDSEPMQIIEADDFLI